MKIIDLKTEKETTLSESDRVSCALGNFDGVHLGHRVLLRIAAEGQAAAAEQPSSLVLQLDEDGLTLHAGDLTVTLTENEALLLSLLLQHRGEPVTKETLHRALCGGEDTPSGSNKVEVHLCNLRRKLEQPLGLRLISTVRGQGYRLLP